jgi:hypothetical protein
MGRHGVVNSVPGTGSPAPLGGRTKAIFIEQALSSISNGVLPLALLALSSRSQAAEPLYFYSFYLVIVVVYRSGTGIPILVSLSSSPQSTGPITAAVRNEVAVISLLGTIGVGVGVLTSGDLSILIAALGLVLIILAGDACRYCRIAQGKVRWAICGDAIWLMGFCVGLPMAREHGARPIMALWLLVGAAGSVVIVVSWLLEHHGPLGAPNYLFQFRLACATELGIDRVTTTLSEAGVGLLTGPTGIALIQLGRTLWSPMSIVFTALQATGTRAIGMAATSARLSIASHLRKRCVTAVASAYTALVALCLMLPSSALGSGRLERLLAVTVPAIYFLAYAIGLGARIVLRVQGNMRTLIVIQAVGGLLGLGASLLVARFCPWYTAIIIGNSTMIVVAISMQTAAQRAVQTGQDRPRRKAVNVNANLPSSQRNTT